MLLRISLGILVIFMLTKSILSDESIQVPKANDAISTTEGPPNTSVKPETTLGTKNFSSVEWISPEANGDNTKDLAKSGGLETQDFKSLSDVDNNTNIATEESMESNHRIYSPTTESNRRLGDLNNEMPSNIQQETTAQSVIEENEDSYYTDIPSNIGISEDADFGIQYVYSYDSDVPRLKKTSSKKTTDYDYAKADEEPPNSIDSLTRAEGTQKVTIVKQKSVHSSLSREEKEVNVKKNPEPRVSNEEDIVIEDHQAIRSESSDHPEISQNEGTIVLLDESHQSSNYGSGGDDFGFHGGSSFDELSDNGASIKSGQTSNPSGGIQFNNHGDGISTQYFLTKHNGGLNNLHSDSSMGQTSIGSKYVPSPQISGDLGGDLNGHLSGVEHLQGNDHSDPHIQGGKVIIVHKVDPNQIYIDEKTGNLIKFVTEDGSGSHFQDSSKTEESDIGSHDLGNDFGVKNNPSHSSQGLFPPSSEASFNKNHQGLNGGGSFHKGSIGGNSQHHQLLSGNQGHSKQQTNGNSDNPVDYIVLCDGKGKIDYDNSHNSNDFGKKLNFGGQNSGNKGHNFGGQNSGSKGHNFGGQNSGNKGHNFGGQNSGNIGLNFGGQNSGNKGHNFGGQNSGNIGLNFGGQNSGNKGHNFGGQNSGNIGLNFGGQNSGNKGHNFGGQVNNANSFRPGNKGGKHPNINGGNFPIKINLGGGNLGSHQGGGNFQGLNNQVHISSGNNNPFGGMQHSFPSGQGGINHGSNIGSLQISGHQKGTNFPTAGIQHQNNVQMHLGNMQNNNFKGIAMTAVQGQGHHGIGMSGGLQGNIHSAKGTPFPVLNGGGGQNEWVNKGDNSILLNQGNSKGSQFNGGMNVQNSFKGTSLGNGGIGIQHVGQMIHNSLKSNNNNNFQGSMKGSGGHNFNTNDFQNQNGDLHLGLQPSFEGVIEEQQFQQHSLGGTQNQQPHMEWILVDLDQGNGKKSGGTNNKYFIEYQSQPKLSVPQSYMSYMSGIVGHSYSGNNGWSNMKPNMRYRSGGGKGSGFQQFSANGYNMAGPRLIQLQNSTPKGNYGAAFHKRTGTQPIPQLYIQKRSDAKSGE